MTEAVQTSETSVNSYQSTRRYNPEDSRLHSHCRENLRAYVVKESLMLGVHVSYFSQRRASSNTLAVVTMANLRRDNFWMKIETVTDEAAVRVSI
jgi:hypothetical protein